jgi:RND family efflux transporter MFP subunit
MKWLSVLVAVAALGQNGKLPAELTPYQKVTVRARIAGTVEKVLVDRGSVVKEGDLLVELSAPEMQAQIAESEARAQAIEAQRAEAEAKLAALESTHEKLKAAAATPGAVAANDVVQAARQADAMRALISAIGKSAAAARAQARVLSEMQAYLKITAPFGGVITQRHVDRGAVAGGPLLELEQVSRLRLVVMVPESEWKSVARGVRVNFTVASHGDRIFSGAVTRISRTLDSKTRAMAVEADVDNSSGALAPGMYAEATLALKK